MPALNDSRAAASWRKAANRLLRLEAALIVSQRGTTPESSFGRELDAAVKKARTTADGLYEGAARVKVVAASFMQPTAVYRYSPNAS